MKIITIKLFSLMILFLLPGCYDVENETSVPEGGRITRKHNEQTFSLATPQKMPLPPYPWQEGKMDHLPRITKEFFRCRGSLLNPERSVELNGKTERILDCGGSDKHSLPLRDGKEFIYPILVQLMNYIQNTTGHRVVITSGHRCPEHNTYVDATGPNRYSKHMIGAEVSFYVQGMEHQSDKIIDHLIAFYQQSDEQEYKNFNRYEKDDTNVSTKPWYNKEIFIKSFKTDEGRNLDNRHPYPYIAIQVRYDRDLNQRVVYNWDLAYKNYLRR